jgi:hypothetical protein
MVLLLFALLVFSMFIQLIIASCKKEIQLLVMLGTAPAQLRRYLLRQFVPLYVITGIAAILLVAALQWVAARALAAHKMAVSPWPGAGMWAAAALVLLLVYIVNNRTIRKYLR